MVKISGKLAKHSAAMLMAALSKPKNQRTSSIKTNDKGRKTYLYLYN